MILYACVVRLQDGLPLSASTDFHANKQLLECKRWVKKLSVGLAQRPARGTVPAGDLSIHFCSSGDVSCLAVCASGYPSDATFCFLEELTWEFSSSYSSSAIALTSRPYTFQEFDSFIQRVKHNFNFLEGPPIRLDPSPPPVCVKLEEVAEVNGFANGHVRTPVHSAADCRLTPVSSVGILSLILNIMCSALSLVRGVHLAENSFQDGYENAGRVLAFLTAFTANILQCHLYLFHCPARTPRAWSLFLLICLCNLYLYGLRNHWQILFHVSVAFLSAQQIVSRKAAARRRDCGV